LKNFHRVDARLYRGAQPSEEGMHALRAMGVRSVVSLRSREHDAAEDTAAAGLISHRIPMSPWNPSDEQVVRLLRTVIEAQKRGPVFVHCQHGADRTGMMIAVYRIVVQGWSKQAALNEMTDGGFGHHSIYRPLRKYVERMDVESIRHRAGVPTPGESPILLADAGY
jgi:protein tyrosine/serine phosphatase